MNKDLWVLSHFVRDVPCCWRLSLRLVDDILNNIPVDAYKVALEQASWMYSREHCHHVAVGVADTFEM